MKKKRKKLPNEIPVIKRTQAPPNYIEPHDSEVHTIASLLGLQSYPVDLVRDFANVAAGGSVLPPSARDEDIEIVAEMTLPPKDNEGKWHIQGDDGYYESTKTKKKALAYRIKMLERFHNNVCDFINTIDFSQIPGGSPLVKAVLLLKMLMIRNYESYHDYPSGSTESDVEQQGVPTFHHEGQTAGTAVNDILSNLKDLDALEKEFVKSDLFQEHYGASPVGHHQLQRMSIAEDMAKGSHLWIKVSRKLEILTKMRVSKSKDFVADIEGHEVRSRQIENLNEISKLRATEWTYPKTQRRLRIATRAAVMRERGRYKEKQQLLYIIVDCSGSMAGEKIHKAGGVLMNRLKAVCKGDAQLYVRFFDTKLHPEHSAKNKEDALNLMDKFRGENFSGGGTAIANCAMASQERINDLLNNNELLTRPELVIITDGDDRCDSLKVEDFDPTVVHAFIVHGSNPDLIEFAKSTGGIGTGNL